MIGVVGEAVGQPAELGAVVLGVLAITVGLLGLRQAVVPWAAVLGLLGLALQAALFREGRATDGVRALPWDAWTGQIALYHGYAARIGWLCALLAAGVLAFDAGAEPGARRPAPGRGWLFGAVGIWALSAWEAPELAWVLVPALGLAWVGGVDTPRGRVAVGLGAALCGVAALAGAEAHLYGLAALVDPGDVHRLDAAALARIGAWLGALLAFGWGARRIGRSFGLVPLAGLLVAVALVGGAAHRARAVGPARGIDASALPVWLPNRAARVSGGCLVERGPDGWVGRDLGPPRTPGDDILARRGLPGCPATVTPGGFGPDGVPLFAVPGDTPVSDLLGWHGSPVGELAVLVRLDDGWALPDFRISAVRFAVWEAPGITAAGELAPLDPRGIPLPGSVLVQGEATFERQLARIRAGTAGAARPQVLIHPSAAPTIDALLALCRAAEAEHGPGLRCVIATGDPLRWARVLRSGSSGVIDPDAVFEVIETDGEIPE